MAQNESMLDYQVDVVFCIDTTQSMHKYLESVKAKALQFHQLLVEGMAAKDKKLASARLRVVSFRDLGHEGPDAIEASRFFRLPDESDAYKEHVDQLRALGGGDEPESGLEALVVAIRSPWLRTGPRRRHVIVMCTDASAHDLGRFAMTETDQQAAMPASLSELHRIWGDSVHDGEMEFKAKRLLLFAPERHPWSLIAEQWENVITYPSAAGEGLQSADQSLIIGMIAGSV